MSPERIERLESAIHSAAHLPEETRRELLRLLAELKAEFSPLAASHDEDARSIADFAALSVRETTRPERKPALAEAALKGLTLSVEGFEASHPKLVAIVDRIAVTLSNMGI